MCDRTAVDHVEPAGKWNGNDVKNGMQDPAKIVWQLFEPPEHTRLAWMSRRPEILVGSLASLEELRGLIRRYGNSDCYFTPNPVDSPTVRRPSTEHISYVRMVCFDLDPVETSFDMGYAERMVLDHAEHLLGFKLSSDRIDSGRGRQLWNRFKSAPVISQEEKSLWRASVGNFLNRLNQDLGIMRGVRLDSSCSDLPRLVRLPGTVNTKTGRVAQFLEVGESDSRVREAILSRFGMASAPSHTNGIGNGGDWRHNAHWLSGRAKWFIYHGVSEPGRHSAAFAAASSMKELGASQVATEAAVLRGAMRCSPPLSEYEAKRCVRNAFAKGDI